MIWTILKWGLGSVLLVALVLTLTGKKTFHVEIIIPAAPEAVWAVLTDAEKYHEWNPVFVHVEGGFAADAQIKTTVREPGKDDVVISSKVINYVPKKHLNQFGGVRGLITFDHNWLLEPVEGGTKVIQHETDRGFYVWFWKSDWVEPAYRKASEALKERVLQIQTK